MTRAVMEGVIFSLRDSLEIMRSLGVPVEDVEPHRRRGEERSLAPAPGRHLRHPHP